MTHRSNFFSRLIREPLVHFLALGAGLFLLYAYVGDGGPGRDDRIVVDEAEILRLAEQFQRTWMRPPTDQELQGLAEDFVKEEVLYREAVALGLDRDDLVIRRRMRQKMEFLNADLVEQREPTDSELQAYLDTNPNRFRRPGRYSFQQIYINPKRSGNVPRERAKALLSRIQAAPALVADPRSLGDATLLPPGLERASTREISAVFGTELAEAVTRAEQGVWSGPYISSYGLHLVHLAAVEQGGMPALTEVRPAVEREWTAERRQEANERFYRALSARYSVEIRLRGSVAGDKLADRRP